MGAESDKHLFPESCLQEDWTDDYARSEGFESGHRSPTDPEDGQKWPKLLSWEDGSFTRMVGCFYRRPGCSSFERV